MSNDAQTFLSRVLPWGNPDAFYNIHYSFKPATNFNPKKPPFTGVASKDLSGAVKAVGDALRWNDHLGIYVCLSSQAKAEEQEQKTGSVRLKARKNQDDAIGIKVLAMDIDAGSGDKAKGYADTNEAVAALKEFLAATGLPRPTMIVGSGSGGIQPYWCLNQVLNRDEWQPLANAMVEAARRTGLKIDSSCTIDIARLMRVPGTLNKKGKTPKPVTLAKAVNPADYDVEDIRTILAPYMGATVIPLASKKAPNSVDNSDLGKLQAPLIAIQTMADAGCGFIADGLATGGACFSSQTEWNYATLVATFTEEGRDAAHDLAKGSPYYNEQDTDDLYDRKIEERGRTDIGWPSCSAIAASGCKSCATCPLAKLGKSPLNFGKSSAVAPPAVPLGPIQDDMPARYTRDIHNRITIRVTDDNGNTTEKQLCPYPITAPWIQDHPWTLHFTTQIGHAMRDVPIALPFDKIASNEGFAKEMSRQGMGLNKASLKMLQEFFMAWISKLQTMKDAVITAQPFGWAIVNGKIDGFCYAGRVWGPHGSKPAAATDPNLAKQYTPQGDIQPWLKAAKLMTSQGRPDIDVILATAFSAPLMRFTGQQGVLISAYSQQSGIGKSTAIQVGQAVWGSPIKAVQSLSDTTNSVISKIGALQALPLYWDELKTENETNRFVGLAFQLTQGKEKSRLNADATLRESGSWQTILLAASNDSLLDVMIRQTKTTTAGIYRCFEFAVKPIPKQAQFDMGMVSREVGNLKENFGQAGLVYAKFLGDNHVRIAQEVADVQDKLATKLGCKPDERFWLAAITCTYLGAKYAAEAGLCVIDLKALLAFLVNTLKTLRVERNSQPVDMQDGFSVSSVIQEYLRFTSKQNTLITNNVHQGAGKPARGSIKPLVDMEKLGPIMVHYGVENQIMRIALTPFNDWLAKNGYSVNIVRTGVLELFSGKVTNGIIGAGAINSGMQERLIELDTSGTEMSKFFQSYI